jgi:hypothetical protein
LKPWRLTAETASNGSDPWRRKKSPAAEKKEIRALARDGAKCYGVVEEELRRCGGAAAARSNLGEQRALELRRQRKFSLSAEE